MGKPLSCKIGTGILAGFHQESLNLKWPNFPGRILWGKKPAGHLGINPA